MIGSLRPFSRYASRECRSCNDIVESGLVKGYRSGLHAQIASGFKILQNNSIMSSPTASIQQSTPEENESMETSREQNKITSFRNFDIVDSDNFIYPAFPITTLAPKKLAKGHCKQSNEYLKHSSIIITRPIQFIPSQPVLTPSKRRNPASITDLRQQRSPCLPRQRPLPPSCLPSQPAH